jgi:hypothetical protein
MRYYAASQQQGAVCSASGASAYDWDTHTNTHTPAQHANPYHTAAVECTQVASVMATGTHFLPMYGAVPVSISMMHHGRVGANQNGVNATSNSSLAASLNASFRQQLAASQHPQASSASAEEVEQHRIIALLTQAGGLTKEPQDRQPQQQQGGKIDPKNKCPTSRSKV